MCGWLLSLSIVVGLTQAASPSDLNGYWAAEVKGDKSEPSALFCLKITRATASRANFNDLRKVSWSEPGEKSVTVNLKGSVVIEALEGTDYPTKPNGILNFSIAQTTFRYGEPTPQIAVFQQQATQMVSTDANGTKIGYQRACLYAWGGDDLTDTSVLRMTCSPDDNKNAGINAVLGFGPPPQEAPDVIETSTGVKPVVFEKDPSGHCRVHGQRQILKGVVVTPPRTGWQIWLELSADFSVWTTGNASGVLQDLSQYLECDREQLEIVSTSRGSVVLQLILDGYSASDSALLHKFDQMQSEVEDSLLVFGDFIVLLVEFNWFVYLPGSVPSDALPGWSVTIMLLAGSALLCWVGYTIQCRQMVLDLEKEFAERKGMYRQLPRDIS